MFNNESYVYEFISPIIVEESFLIKEQKYYIDNISDELIEKIKVIINNYMKKLGDRGIASLLNDFLKDLINKIIIYPEIINNKLYCKTMVISNVKLNDINIGILLDFLEDEFMNGFGNDLSNIDIIIDIDDIDYYNKIAKYLKLNNLQYTVRLNFYDYNKFYIKSI